LPFVSTVYYIFFKYELEIQIVSDKIDQMATRGYKQACAIASSLDLLGQRWTLLIVRDLLIGPRRYSDLLAGLPGIGTNLLADRLKALTEAGVVEQASLPAPAATRVYRLTEAGLELERPLVELCRWGLRHGLRAGGEAAHDPRWTVLAMRAAFDSERALGLSVSCEFRVEGTVFHGRVESGELATALGPARDPDVVLSLGDADFRQLVAGEETLEGLLGDDRATLDGDPRDYQRFAAAFVTSPDLHDDGELSAARTM
jgi:DNA-binding HxlR family transcriptional regulator